MDFTMQNNTIIQNCIENLTDPNWEALGHSAEKKRPLMEETSNTTRVWVGIIYLNRLRWDVKMITFQIKLKLDIYETKCIPTYK